MRYPADHKEQTRARIVRAAGRRFRGRGAQGATIPDLMHDLRLTHGGFYRHFRTKDELFAEAFADCLGQVSARLTAAVSRAPAGGELRAIVEAYFSDVHCGNMAEGCPLAALGSELPRLRAGARGAIVRALEAYFHSMAPYIPGASEGQRARRAATLFSGMAGTLSLVRAIPDGPERERALADARRLYVRVARV